MIHIAICDDEPSQLLLLERLAGEWAKQQKVELKVTLSRNSDQFLFGWEGKKDIDILLLDIEMPGMDGITLARRLREMGESLQIIFVTGMTDYVLEGYDVDAVSYLLKPVGKEKLFTCLDRARGRMGKAEPAVLLDTAEGLVRVKLMEICYVESMAHETMVHCLGDMEEIRCKAGISQMEKALGEQSDGFYRIHRSYLVNMAHVERITRKEVYAASACLPIARGKWEAVNSSYLSYHRRRSMYFA